MRYVWLGVVRQAYGAARSRMTVMLCGRMIGWVDGWMWMKVDGSFQGRFEFR